MPKTKLDELIERAAMADAEVERLVGRAAAVQSRAFAEALREELIRQVVSRFPSNLSEDAFLTIVGSTVQLTAMIIETWAGRTGASRELLYATAAGIMECLYEARTPPGADDKIN